MCPLDPQYWNDLASYLKTSGVMTYEQDWLASFAAPLMNLTDPEAYLDEYGEAPWQARASRCNTAGNRSGIFCKARNTAILTTARVSPDGFNQ